MWSRLSFRLNLVLVLLFTITLSGGLVTVWYTFQIEKILSGIIEHDLAAFQAAESLENALVIQKGFVSYYFIDSNPDWLRQLGEYRQIFKDRLQTARMLSEDAAQRKAVDQIETAYEAYITNKDRVINLYAAGDRANGSRLHETVRNQFSRILDLCAGFKGMQIERINASREQSGRQGRQLRVIAAAAVLVVLLLSAFLAFILLAQVLMPIRRLITAARRGHASPPSADEILTLSRTVLELIQDVDQTQNELERSREHLLQAEKMAVVGKLAAGMAHSIRNPFTSVKMRLFSLSRSLDLTSTQKEDFDVISEEIRHVDTIVQNFLEFSRPPKLKIQPVSPSLVVDLVLQLLEHRLRSYDVSVSVDRREPLPEVQADPEQLKEVLVNLVINACEAMRKGGRVTILESQEQLPSMGRAAVIRVRDDGPGVSAEIREKIFQPFFTTKEEGTGLGLSIAQRIVHEHRGQIEVNSEAGKGATFTVALPLREAQT